MNKYIAEAMHLLGKRFMTDEDILRNYELLKNKTLFLQCTGTLVSVQQVHLLEKYRWYHSAWYAIISIWEKVEILSIICMIPVFNIEY